MSVEVEVIDGNVLVGVVVVVKVVELVVVNWNWISGSRVNHMTVVVVVNQIGVNGRGGSRRVVSKSRRRRQFSGRSSQLIAVQRIRHQVYAQRKGGGLKW